MHKIVEFELRKYAASIEMVAFFLTAIYESACQAINKDLPPGQHTRLMPEVVCYKPGKIQINWTVMKRSECTGAIYYKREWPEYQGEYPRDQLKTVADPSELKLALEIERYFVWLREASVTMTVLKNTAKRLDKIAEMLSPRIRDLSNKYQGHKYGGDVEKILGGLYEDQDIWEDLTERAVRDEVY